MRDRHTVYVEHRVRIVSINNVSSRGKYSTTGTNLHCSRDTNPSIFARTNLCDGGRTSSLPDIFQFSRLCLRILDKYAAMRRGGFLQRRVAIFWSVFEEEYWRGSAFFSFLFLFLFFVCFFSAVWHGERSSERRFSTFNLYVCIDRGGYRKIKY